MPRAISIARPPRLSSGAALFVARGAMPRIVKATPSSWRSTPSRITPPSPVDLRATITSLQSASTMRARSTLAVRSSWIVASSPRPALAARGRLRLLDRDPRARGDVLSLRRDLDVARLDAARFEEILDEPLHPRRGALHPRDERERAGALEVGRLEVVAQEP